MKRTGRLLATRAINRRVITTAWLTLEKCPMMLDKLLKPRLCRKLGFKLAYAFFEVGILFFQLRYLIFESLQLQPLDGVNGNPRKQVQDLHENDSDVKASDAQPKPTPVAAD